jgi:dihydroflavonol-4-reductase
MSRYLVTGATGFLGAHVVALLRDRGQDVVPFSRGAGGDVLDAGAVAAAARGCEGAFHCAGKVSRRREDAEELYRVHVEGTKSVLTACARAGVRRVVVASTSGTVAVSTTPDRVATEESPAPIDILSRWPYYRAKLFAERAALAFDDARLEVLCVNPSLLLGPGDARGSSTEDVRLLLEGQIPAVPAGGLSFVDARDAAGAMVLAMDRGRTRERYLAGACNLTVREFFARLARVGGVPAPWLPMPRSPGIAAAGARFAQRLAARTGLTIGVDPVSVEMAQHFWYVDSSKAERELGWNPRDPGMTLRDTVHDLRARGVVWPADSIKEGTGAGQ